MSLETIQSLNQQFDDILNKNDLKNASAPELIKKLKVYFGSAS